jgi:acyl transferase domain-containing protein
MQQAVSAIRTGQCDSALVGGVNLLLKPTCSLQFHRLSMLSPDGMCKAFDSSGKLWRLYFLDSNSDINQCTDVCSVYQ